MLASRPSSHGVVECPTASWLAKEDVSANDVWELNTQSFIIRFWLEEPKTETSPAVWRGHVTHVLTGARRYISSLAEITEFLAMYLREMGVDC